MKSSSEPNNEDSNPSCGSVDQPKCWTLVVPFPPGGSTDYTAKVLAEALRRNSGRYVGVETIDGNFGIDCMVRVVQDRDSHALMVGSINTNSMTPVFHKERLPFGYAESMVPITKLAVFPSVIAARRESTAGNLRDVLLEIKKSGARVRYGVDFPGTYVDVDILDLTRSVGVGVAYHVSNGAFGILGALANGQIDLCLLNVATATAHQARYRPLAVIADKRLAVIPEVPTTKELGFIEPGATNWQGLFGSARMGSGTVNALHRWVHNTLDTDEGRLEFELVGAHTAISRSPGHFAQEIEIEMARWRELAPQIGALQEI